MKLEVYWRLRQRLRRDRRPQSPRTGVGRERVHLQRLGAWNRSDPRQHHAIRSGLETAPSRPKTSVKKKMKIKKTTSLKNCAIMLTRAETPGPDSSHHLHQHFTASLRSSARRDRGIR